MSMMSVAGEAWPSQFDGRTTLPRPRDLAASYAHLARLAVTPGIPAPAGSARPVPGSDYRQSSSTSTISSSAPHPLEHMVLASGEVGAQLLGIDTPRARKPPATMSRGRRWAASTAGTRASGPCRRAAARGRRFRTAAHSLLLSAQRGTPVGKLCNDVRRRRTRSSA